MKKVIFSFFAILALYTIASAQTKVSVIEVSNELKKNKKTQLLDVRTQTEYEGKHIANAVNLDWNQKEVFEKGIATHFSKQKPIYVYCLSGGRSAQAAKSLTEMGFTVFDVEGGILKWEQADFPLISSPQIPESKKINLKQFKELTKSEKMVLFDFHASWCAPCKEMDPFIQEISAKYTDRLKVIKIDVDQTIGYNKYSGTLPIQRRKTYLGKYRIYGSRNNREST